MITRAYSEAAQFGSEIPLPDNHGSNLGWIRKISFNKVNPDSRIQVTFLSEFRMENNSYVHCSIVMGSSTAPGAMNEASPAAENYSNPSGGPMVISLFQQRFLPLGNVVGSFTAWQVCSRTRLLSNNPPTYSSNNFVYFNPIGGYQTVVEVLNPAP